MRKRFLIVPLLCGLLLSLAACGNYAIPDDAPPSQSVQPNPFDVAEDEARFLAAISHQAAKPNISESGERLPFEYDGGEFQLEYDTATHTAKPFQNIVASDFCLTEKGLYCINRMDSSSVYLCDRNGADSQKVSNDPALSVVYNSKEVTMTLKADGKEVIWELWK